MKSNIIDLTVIYRHQTEKAILVAGDETAKPVWLPKSQVECSVSDDWQNIGGTIEISLPEPLAHEKGLI